MVDATRRKLHIPNWYSPYLERHRIYELFHELARELVIQMPADHVLFLKDILYNASYSRYAPRIVLLAPPHVNTYDVARVLAEKCKATVITERHILSYLPKVSIRRPKARKLTRCLSEAVRSGNIYYTGWILPDYPKTRKEAKRMQQAGILPTHVFQLIPPFAPSLYDLNFDKDYGIWSRYRRTLLGMRDAFKLHLKEVYIGDKSLQEVVRECQELASVKRRYKAPMIPKVCILGPRGSGRKTQANLTAKKFNLVHVDFEYLLCQAWISESHLGALLRACRDKVGYNPMLLTAVVHKRILQKDCLERGWVLTGFPNTLEDLKFMDMLDTPPNRIIFLESDLNVCRERLLHRRMNVNTASVTNIAENPARALDPMLAIHPKDKEESINSELNYFCEHYASIRKYCGRTANIVEANQPVQWVSECIAAILMRPLPDCDPRCPVESTVVLSEPSDDASSDMDDACICVHPPSENKSDSVL